jgi:imidazolonepropionase-like amidohydrolase
VLTVTQGTLPKATILIRDGKIAEIGTDVEIPEGMHVIEAEGLTVMPGIIDSHSHFSISSGVNEATLAVVPEVRIRDAINSDDITIYRALAGGVTAARLLHGSANPIGGQDAVIKLRWGKPGRELLMDEGPRGVKFALGENPKRSTTRYPDTRLGVESAIRRSFEEGRMYARLWQVDEAARKQGENPAPPRRDLRLEALADIVQGDLRIHSHCYRADEILMLLRMAESYGIRIASLQHVLEGYKVAAEIAAHGASNSTFADWWAYKIEAYDAIPHNAALLNQAGADVVLKSDDQELMRHLYQEAAKTVRYGQMPVEDALATVTINAARQLKLDHRIGSIEVGKDADLAIFNGHPLNGYARCEITLVDGEVYFERRGPHEGSGHEMPVAAAELRSRELSVDDSPSGRYALVGARIVPGDGEPIPRGTVIISDGLIEAVGGPDLEIPEYAASIDLAGLSVYPGMINAGGSLGLTEIGSARETQDFRERGDYNEDLQASIAVHPDSELIPVSRANGITTVLTQPSGGTISGQSVLMNLHGWIPPEMAVVDPMALHVNFPSGSIGNDTSSAAVKQRKKVSDQIDELSERFRLAIRYDDLQHHAKEKDTLPPAPDPKLHALVPYARGQCPVVVHASSHGDILAAIDWAESLELDWILADAGEAWKCTDALKQHNVKVILGPSMRLPGDADEPYDSPYANAAALYDAGVMFAIKAIDSGPGSATSTRNLPFQAAMAVAYGLPVEEGLKAVTLYPAQILGVEDQLGSIAPGKIANLVITDGDMLQPVTQVKWLFVGGRPVSPENRHTHLFERYRHRLDEVRAGRAPLGVGGEVPVSD